MLKFNVENQIISRTDNFRVVADSQNYLTAEFVFSEEWTSPVTAVFAGNGKSIGILIEENTCIVPWEVIKAPFFTISVFCGDRITANTLEVDVEKSGYAEYEEKVEPTPDVYTRLIQLSEETKSIAQSVRSDADRGVFDGEQGIQGVKGEKGDKGDIGYSGLVPKSAINEASGDIKIPANTMTVIPELTAETTLTLGEEVQGYDNEWDFQIIQGAVAQQLTLPTIHWGLGIAPTFGANTTTLCRLYYICEALCGEWVCV